MVSRRSAAATERPESILICPRRSAVTGRSKAMTVSVALAGQVSTGCGAALSV